MEYVIVIEHTAPKCPNKPCSSHCNEFGHIYSRCEVAKALKKEKERERHRKENMSAVQVEQHNARNRLGNMSPEQQERLRQAAHARYRTFQRVEQTWDDENPCKFCFYVSLKSQRNTKGLSVCCHDGEYLKENSPYPKLYPLPEGLNRLCFERGEHFGNSSAKYNNILSIGSTGVENSKGGGYEQVVGDHAVKMNGRSYHFLSKIKHRKK